MKNQMGFPALKGISLALVALLGLGCSGNDGYDGRNGDSGLNCWDKNGDGRFEPGTEDTNGDGVADAQDCTGDTGATGLPGPKGDTGATGATGAPGPKGDSGPIGPPGGGGGGGTPAPTTMAHLWACAATSKSVDPNPGTVADDLLANNYTEKQLSTAKCAMVTGGATVTGSLVAFITDGPVTGTIWFGNGGYGIAGSADPGSLQSSSPSGWRTFTASNQRLVIVIKNGVNTAFQITADPPPPGS